MAYASYSEGLQVGGWTTRLSLATNAADSRFDPE
jgi:hypothetical protein